MKHAKLFLAFSAFLLPFIFYIFTLAPSVGFTDAGELAASALTLGIAHPSGYPLFIILAHLWAALPFSASNIYQMNLFSAFITAASVPFFFLSIFNILKFISLKKSQDLSISDKKIKKKSNTTKDDSLSFDYNENAFAIIAFAISLAYAFAALVWQQANSIEVYSLHLLLVNLTIFAALKSALFGEKKWDYAAALFLGLSFANHLTTILLVPALLYLYFTPNGKFDFSKNRFKNFALLIIPIFIGLSLYLYLPIRASMQPDFNWGYVSRNWDKFIYHASGKQYQIWMQEGSAVWGKNLGIFFSLMWEQLLLIFILPSIAAFSLFNLSGKKPFWLLMTLLGPIFTPFYLIYKLEKRIFYFFLILAIFCIAYSMNYSIHDISSYFLAAYMSIIAIFGISSIALSKYKLSTLYLILIIPLFSLAYNYSSSDVSDDYTVQEYTKILVDNLEPNAIILSAQWDYWVSPFWYYQKIENYRTDVVLVEKELMRRTWYPYQFAKWYPDIAKKSESELDLFLPHLENFEEEKPYDNIAIQTTYLNYMNSFIDNNIDKLPIYITYDVLQSDPGIGEKYNKIPHGFALKLTKDTNYVQPKLHKINIDKFISSLKGKKGHLYDGIAMTAAANLMNIARYAEFNNDSKTAESAMQLADRIRIINSKK